MQLKECLYCSYKTETKELTKNGVNRVHGDLVLGGITNETLGVGEPDIRRRRSVTLVVGNDLNTIMLPDTDTRVGGSEIDSDGWTLTFAGHAELDVVSANEERSERFRTAAGTRSGVRRGRTKYKSGVYIGTFSPLLGFASIFLECSMTSQ